MPLLLQSLLRQWSARQLHLSSSPDCSSLVASEWCPEFLCWIYSLQHRPRFLPDIEGFWRRQCYGAMKVFTVVRLRITSPRIDCSQLQWHWPVHSIRGLYKDRGSPTDDRNNCPISGRMVRKKKTAGNKKCQNWASNCGTFFCGEKKNSTVFIGGLGLWFERENRGNCSFTSKSKYLIVLFPSYLISCLCCSHPQI